MKRKSNTNKIRMSKFLFVGSFLFFVAIIIQLTNLALSKSIMVTKDKTLSEFVSERNTAKKTLSAKRGTIYDTLGNPLARNVLSYTVIAYLDPKRSEDSKTLEHVSDKEMTAEALSPVLGMEKEKLIELLSKTGYQVELGPGGRGISELKKEEIESLKLPGIDFISSYKRYYPNGDFAAYTLGYAKNDESGTIIGEMGVEQYFNEALNGQNGYLEFQRDRMGYKIPNTPERRIEPINGEDIYLTIDSNIQIFVENAVKEATALYTPEWMVFVVMEAKTGKILGVSSSPSFDPNVKNITNYLNPLVSYTYEPGSTMKTYTYMAAMEKGVYNGSDTFLSGKFAIGDDTVRDWNNGAGWGRISFDRGYALSSNVGVSNMMNMDGYLSAFELKSYFQRLGFGSKTEILLPKESRGSINFKYPIEIANAAFGQGITTTVIQNLQALTPIANDGMMLRPYIVEKVVDSTTNKIISEYGKEELGSVASKSTTDKIKSLMYEVVHGAPGAQTGNAYNIEGFEMIGKTGTAQIANPEGAGYLTGAHETIRSFAGMFPANDPEIIIYAVTSKAYGSNNALSSSVKTVAENTAKYLNIFDEDETSMTSNTFEVSNYLNKSIEDIESILEAKNIKVVKIGNGNKIIKQYPSEKTIISKDDMVFLLTNDATYKMPNMYNWSSKEVNTFFGMIEFNYKMEGNGFVVNQSLAEGELIDNTFDVIINMSPKGFILPEN